VCPPYKSRTSRAHAPTIAGANRPFISNSKPYDDFLPEPRGRPTRASPGNMDQQPLTTARTLLMVQRLNHRRIHIITQRKFFWIPKRSHRTRIRSTTSTGIRMETTCVFIRTPLQIRSQHLRHATIFIRRKFDLFGSEDRRIRIRKACDGA